MYNLDSLKNKDWFEENETIEKEFVFKNFIEALAFVNRVGSLAEENNHHPDILLHSYKKVRISLTSHEEKTLTDKDLLLASLIEKAL